MSSGTLDRPAFEAIEAYVLDRMGAEERAAFEHRMAHDPDLRREVGLERENIQAVELGGLDRMLTEIAAQERAPAQGGGLRRYWRYAAAAALLIAAGAWWLTRPTAGERLFAEHFAADPGLPVAMGAADDAAFNDAMVAYKLGDYQEARDKWSRLSPPARQSDTVRYYSASAALAMGDAQGAIPLLEGVASEAHSAFAERATWYLLLAYVRRGDLDKAKALAFPDGSAYQAQARALQARLDE